MADASYDAGYAKGYSDGLQVALDAIAAEPNYQATSEATDAQTLDTDTNLTDPEIVRDRYLPILMDDNGTWLDQNAEPIPYANSERFFKCNREYAKVAVAINSLCEELQSDFYQNQLDTISSWATAEPYDTEEHLRYEWLLGEMEANYDNYLNDLLVLIGNQIDFNNSPAARTATCIILEKMLQFRDDGTYEAAINPHRKHDCEAEGCNEPPAYYHNPTSASLPVVSDAFDILHGHGSEKPVEKMSDAEIIAYLDEQCLKSPTQFDLQHANLYFDAQGNPHGYMSPDEELYVATSSGEVYQLRNRSDRERLNISPDHGPEALGTYVGTTNRLLK